MRLPLTQYTIRAFVKGRNERLDGICRTFSSMERTAYNLLRDGEGAADIKAILRERYEVKNARWIQSAINQGRAVMEAQVEGIRYRVEMCMEKVDNTEKKMRHLRSPLKVQSCKAKITRLASRIDGLKRQLAQGTYPRAVFGSKGVMQKLSITNNPKRKKELRAEWREMRSNHFFSVGQANQRGNGNTRILYGSNDSIMLEVKNWPRSDFAIPLKVPEHWRDTVRRIVETSRSVRLGGHGELLEENRGLPYSVRVVRSKAGYQVLVSFDLRESSVEWSGRMAGVDVNPEGIGYAIVSRDGNLAATRFSKDSRFITASSNKRKWLLENAVNRMLRWCRDTYQCNAVAVENLRFKGAYDYGARTNFKFSNFMKTKMLEKIRLSALKMGMLTAEVDPAYSTKVAIAKYGRRFGGSNRHQLAAFVIARRALGYGEAPPFGCLPKTRREQTMWNRCISYYSHQPAIRTLPRREPLERKSVGDVNGGGVMTELLRAPPAVTSSPMGFGRTPSQEGAIVAFETIIRRAGRVRPNGHASRGDGARGDRVNPPDADGHRSAVVFDVNDDNDTC